ncbi:hypothetical protein ACQP1P_33600 [Dactylosporangium sp. CA-052675]|uniref:hypothetical protein n=1 Tax=Dactylosporangium sp. CA-052675 TaxID=3239927 RepID=UPI003D944BAF
MCEFPAKRSPGTLTRPSKIEGDDSLDVAGVHGVGGLIGTLLIGLLATAAVTGGPRGLFYGGGVDLLGRQALAVLVVAAYAFGVTWLLAKGVDRLVGFRVAAEDEHAGLDLVTHAESAYEMHTTALTGHMR